MFAANWKMNKLGAQALAWVAELEGCLRLLPLPGIDLAVAPPSPYLAALAGPARRAGIALLAQDCHPEGAGSFTGDVSPTMLADVGVTGVLVGHSERRRDHGEDDALVARKCATATRAGLLPLVCVGESLAERESGTAVAVLRRQLDAVLAALAGIGLPGAALVLAYEPVWAIGTGRIARPEQAQEACAGLRERLRAALGAERADATRILYGGSVTPENASEVLAGEDVDGALVGGASLDPRSFARIAAARCGCSRVSL